MGMVEHVPFFILRGFILLMTKFDRFEIAESDGTINFSIYILACELWPFLDEGLDFYTACHLYRLLCGSDDFR